MCPSSEAEDYSSCLSDMLRFTRLFHLDSNCQEDESLLRAEHELCVLCLIEDDREGNLQTAEHSVRRAGVIYVFRFCTFLRSFSAASISALMVLSNLFSNFGFFFFAGETTERKRFDDKTAEK